MALRRLLILIFIGGALLHAEQTIAVIVPPAPVRPSPQGLPYAEREAIDSKWRADYRAWKSSLTAEQEAERKRIADEKARQLNEKMERQRRLPLPTDGYTWQQAAGQWELDARVIERLGRDKIAYGPTIKQSFSPYLGGPVFITSDSLLNAFHVLFEDTYRDREVRQAVELRTKLEAVFQQTQKNIAEWGAAGRDLAPAWRHVQMVVGPALLLLGTSIDIFDADVRDEIQGQVAKIRAAQSVELPGWLAPATGKMPAMDYRAGKPVGFYSQDATLADYFRAVRWLQMVPFRMDRDVELVAIGLLGHGMSEVSQNIFGWHIESYGSVLGSTHERGLTEAADEFQFRLSGKEHRALSERLPDIKKSLLRNVTPRDPQTDKLVLPANAADLLAQIEFRMIPAYDLPDTILFQHLADMNLDPEGLAVAAMLGSNFARDRFSHFTPAQFDTAMTRVRAKETKSNLVRYPTLYESYLYVMSALLMAPPSDGPAFLRGDAWQAKSCQTVLSGWAQMRHAFTLQAHLSIVYFGINDGPPGFVEPNPEFFSRLADLIERSRRLLDGNRDRWDALASVARKLEALAHKQLRVQPWSHEDEQFLKGYGKKMGFVMGYDGNSYEKPNDDAPRWAEVHRNVPGDFSLAAAIGRPRVIYVLYPWNGMEILCRGSVMPYYEDRSKERRTDAEWKGLLDSPQAPDQPDWLRPFVAN